MNEGQLIQLYREVYAKRAGTPRLLTPDARRDKDCATARKFLDWCSEHGVLEHARYLEVRFAEVAKKGSYPRFSGLASESALDRYARLGAQAAIAATAVAPQAQRLRELSYLLDSQEAVRRGYPRERRWACRSDALSGGFDPRSVHCRDCPEAAACADDLRQREGFDVSALRAGDLHRLPPELRALLRGWRGGV